MGGQVSSAALALAPGRSISGGLAVEAGVSALRRQNRRPISDANVLSVDEAIAELGMRDSEARRWLREQGLIHLLPGGARRVLARELADAVAACPVEGDGRKGARMFRRGGADDRVLLDLPMAKL